MTDQELAGAHIAAIDATAGVDLGNGDVEKNHVYGELASPNADVIFLIQSHYANLVDGSGNRIWGLVIMGPITDAASMMIYFHAA